MSTAERCSEQEDAIRIDVGMRLGAVDGSRDVLVLPGDRAQIARRSAARSPMTVVEREHGVACLREAFGVVLQAHLANGADAMGNHHTRARAGDRVREVKPSLAPFFAGGEVDVVSLHLRVLSN